MRALTAAALFVVMPCLVLSCSPHPAGSRPGAEAKDFRAMDLAGKEVKLSEYRGKVVLLNFWATWCGPCRREMPELARMRDALSPRGFEVLAINAGEDVSVVRKFASEQGIGFPIWTGYPKEDPGWLYGVRGIPTNILIDREGHIRYRSAGYSAGRFDALRTKIEALLDDSAKLPR